MKSSSAGFTLIELLVVVTITTVITGSVIVNYNTYNQNQTLRQTALTLKNNLRLAQANAQSAYKPQSGCTSLVGYRVTTSGASYVIQPDCKPEGAVASNMVSVSLGGGVTLTPNTAISFRSLSQGVTISGATSQVFSISGFGRTYRIRLEQSGDIVDCGFSPAPC